MTITLSAEQQRLIDESLQAGHYRTANELIARALEVLRAEDAFLHEQKDAIDMKIDRALAQFERGEFLNAEDSRTNMEHRKSDWLRSQPR